MLRYPRGEDHYKGTVRLGSKGVLIPHGRGSWVCGYNYMEVEGKHVLKGTKYEGYWVNGKKEGWGTEISPNGYKYVGHWEGDRPEGKGVLTDQKGTVVFEGIWKKGLQYTVFGGE
jgi:hypothetical protein